MREDEYFYEVEEGNDISPVDGHEMPVWYIVSTDYKGHTRTLCRCLVEANARRLCDAMKFVNRRQLSGK